MAEALSRQNESLVSISRAEHAQNPSIVVPQSHSLTYFLIGLLLLVVTGVGGLFTYNEFVEKTTPPEPVVPQGKFISAESTTEINISSLSREEIFGKITDVTLGLRAGELKHVVVRNNIGTTTVQTAAANFLEALGSNAPGSLVRAFDKEFMLGSLGESAFLIMKLSSFPNAFAGMLTWESSLAPALSGLFSNVEMLKQTSTQSVYRDVVWKNKDVRALYTGTSTEPLLLYSFFDNTYLVITDQLSTLDTIIERLTREKLSR